jgi:PAS domain S-box-containing protein
VAQPVGEPVLRSIAYVIGVEIRPFSAVPPDIQQVVREGVKTLQQPVAFSVNGHRYLAYRYDHHFEAVLVAGPYALSSDPEHREVPTVTSETEARIPLALEAASEGIYQFTEQQRERIEIASQFELMNGAIIAITAKLSLDNVLNRIVDLARAVAGARYAALGVPGPGGELEKFITSGLTQEQRDAIGELPKGRGVLGALIRERRSMRLRNIADHPTSVGFPKNHPNMHSFLGVPIISRGEVVGNLYLTEKRFGDEFTPEDEQLVELLARHAAVAIENAKLYAVLLSHEERLRFVIDQLPEAVVLVETDPERVTMANQQVSNLLGWDMELPLPLAEFLRRNPRYGPDGRQLADDEMPVVRSLRHGEIVAHSEIAMARPDGSQLTLLVNSAPLRQPDGTIVAATIVFQDITLLKDAEQLKDDFLSLVSHELRTPLTTIHGGAQLLMETSVELEPAARQEILQDVLSESKRLVNLVENMVQLANIRAGRFRIEAEPVHVGFLIRRALRAVEDATAGREIRVEQAPDLLASGDIESLDQVLRNLLQNVAKYVPDQSPIDVHATERDGMVLISVRDYGKGIDPNELPLLFDRFQRGREKATTSGMGLGLYLSRMIVEAHGGQLWFELPDGGGSRFVFSVLKAEPE